MKVSSLFIFTVFIGAFFLLSVTSTRGNTRPSSFLFQTENHPRLFFSTAQQAELRSRATGSHAEIWSAILEGVEANLQVTSTIPANPDLNFFREQGNRLIPLAFACVISERADICETGKMQALVHSTWEQWDVEDTRDLGLAHMLLGNALIYDWLYDHFTREERVQVRTSLAHQGSKMDAASRVTAQVSSWSNWWRRSYVQNHFAINNSALGLAALALSGDVPTSTCHLTAFSEEVNLYAAPGTHYLILAQLVDRDFVEAVASQQGADGYTWWWLSNELWVRADDVIADGSCANLQPDVNRWLDQVQENITLLHNLLEGIGDGTWHEGIPYQNYLLTFVMPFMTNMRDLMGVDLFPYNYLEGYVDWRLHNWLSNGQFILPFGNFDWSWANGYSPQANLRWIASQTGDGRAEWLAQRLIEGSLPEDYVWRVFEFLYYDPLVSPQSPVNQSLSYISPDLESVIWRTGWDAGALVFGLRAGALGGRYNSNTFVGQIVPPWNPPCQESGCQLNIDHDHDDAGSFTIFQNEHWLVPEVVRQSYVDAMYHNTLLVNGQGQYRPPAEHYGMLAEELAGRDAILETALDTQALAYAQIDLSGRYRHISGVEQVRRQVIFVRPDYFIIHDTLESDRPQIYDWIAHFEEAVRVDENWLRGAALDNQLLGVAARSKDPLSLSTGDNGLPYGQIQLTAEDTSLTTLLFPTDEQHWHERPAFEITYAEQALLVRVTLPNFTDEIILNLGTGQAENTIGQYSTDAQVVRIRRSTSGTIQDIAVLGGTFINNAASSQPP